MCGELFLFWSFIFWSFEFVSDFGFRASDLFFCHLRLKAALVVLINKNILSWSGLRNLYDFLL